MSHSHSSHGHGHGHGHEHGHTHARRERPSLEPKLGRLLFIDAFSGVSGDMFISGMLDLGVPLAVVQEAVSTLPLDGYRLEQGTRFRNGIAATSFDVHVDQDQPHRTWRDIDGMLGSAKLPQGVAERARAVFARLAEAEGQVHGISPNEVHFHEVGAVDAIVDIVGAAAMVTWLAPTNVLCSPLPMGHGTIRADHGVLPLPAPATVTCLRGVPTYGVDVEGEMVTPTGAAIISTFADGFVRWPSIEIERAGFGSGSKDWGDRPNLIRMVVGTETAEASASSSGTHTIIETNVDDMTGELAGHTIAKLMNLGALDVWATPSTTKKGRPGLVLSVLVGKPRAVELEQAVLRETTSLGVRLYDVTRLERPRTMSEVRTRFGLIPLKVAGGGFGADQVKPEFDACVKAAEEHGVTVREVLAEIGRVVGSQ
jgi:pyridinium-3,5-bisthiocarboxylic acid mononucleotide nickel chelatase